MDEGFRKILLDEAIRIGDVLLSKSQKGPDGLSWKTMSVDMESNVYWSESESIYAGAAGISLFFMELFKATHNEKYLQTAKEGMRWCVNYSEKNPTDYYAFFTGRMGVSYALLRLHQIDRQPEYLNQALNNAKNCADFLKRPTVINDLINGTSGAVLGLLHLHAATKESWLLERIELFMDHLLKTAYHGRQGLYWDRAIDQIHGLCGFSHGAAGIGFVFLELGHYFQNPAYYYIAEQAFAYENHWFNEENSNWPDFRKGTWDEKSEKQFNEEFQKGNTEFFTKGGNMNAWCHGAAGIGLSRIRAYELLKHETYHRDILRTVERIQRDQTRMEENGADCSILCHGVMGNMDFPLECLKYFKSGEYENIVVQGICSTLKECKSKGFYGSGYGTVKPEIEDYSLFMGISGIGYQLLNVLNPDGTDSILSPKMKSVIADKISSAPYPNINLSLSEIREKSLKLIFSRTITVARHLLPQDHFTYFKEENIENVLNDKSSFISFIHNESGKWRLGVKEIILDAFSLEEQKVKMDDSIESNALLGMMHRFNSLEMESTEKSDDAFNNQDTYQLNPYVTIQKLCRDWNEKHESAVLGAIKQEPGEYYILLITTPKEIVEMPLTEMSYAIINLFCTPKTIRQTIDELMNLVEIENDNTNDYKNYFKNQILELKTSFIIKKG